MENYGISRERAGCSVPSARPFAAQTSPCSECRALCRGEGLQAPPWSPYLPAGCQPCPWHPAGTWALLPVRVRVCDRQARVSAMLLPCTPGPYTAQCVCVHVCGVPSVCKTGLRVCAHVHRLGGLGRERLSARVGRDVCLKDSGVTGRCTVWAVAGGDSRAQRGQKDQGRKEITRGARHWRGQAGSAVASQ